MIDKNALKQGSNAQKRIHLLADVLGYEFGYDDKGEVTITRKDGSLIKALTVDDIGIVNSERSNTEGPS